MAAQMARENNKFNCELLKKSAGTIPSANNVIVTELYYNQPQLFGFPIIANPYTDPVPMYTHTTMRMIVASRSSDENTDTVGPVCIALPFTIKNTYVNTATIGTTVFDIMGGESPPAGTDDRGFLAWYPPWQNVTDLETEFLYPRTSFNSYTNARVPSDHSLSVGDYVKSLPGNNNSSVIRDQLDYFIATGQSVIIPVWDQWDSATSSWRISTFIKVRLLANPPYHLTTNNPEVWAVYDGPATECLQ
jgi:hypothetical protein